MWKNPIKNPAIESFNLDFSFDFYLIDFQKINPKTYEKLAKNLSKKSVKKSRKNRSEKNRIFLLKIYSFSYEFLKYIFL